VYALYDALDAAYLQVMVIAIPTSKNGTLAGVMEMSPFPYSPV